MYKEILNKLEKNLSPKRYKHSVRVAETAERLAVKYDADPHLAYLAGLLHDCARDYSGDKLLKYVAAKKLKAKKYELQYPILLHGLVGASLAIEIYGVKDESVLEAIKLHTAGSRNMTALSKIIFIADFIEPGREGSMVDTIRHVVENSLNKAVFEKAQFMLEFSKRVKEKVHPDVLATMEFYKNV